MSAVRIEKITKENDKSKIAHAHADDTYDDEQSNGRRNADGRRNANGYGWYAVSLTSPFVYERFDSR